MYKYCVAQVNISGGYPSVTFYAYTNDQYGLHRVASLDDPHVTWYDTEEQAMRNRWNSNDCVLTRYFEK